jgi:hypothetical protein
VIVLSAGMKKSGSSWLFNMTNELLVHCNYDDAFVIRESYPKLQYVMSKQNCNITNPTWKTWARLSLPMLRHTFVVKTHFPPTPSTKILMAAGLVKVTYICRDVRDVVLSALDHGRKSREKGNFQEDLAQLNSVDEAIDFVAEELSIWNQWIHCPNVLIVRYEDLVAEPLQELTNLAKFLGLSVSDEDLRKLTSRYDRTNLDGTLRERVLLNEGTRGRYKEMMNQSQMELCHKKFGSYLERMRYV